MAGRTFWSDAANTVTMLATTVDSDLNLADGSRAISSGFVNTSGDLFFDATLTLRYTGTGPPAVGTRVAELYVLPSKDGTTHASPTVTGIDPQDSNLVGVFQSIAGSTVTNEVLILQGLQLPARSMKLLVINTAGQAITPSEGVLEITPYTAQVSVS